MILTRSLVHSRSHSLSHIPSLAAIAALALISAGPARAAFSYPGCGDVSDSEFKSSMLFTNATDPATEEPLKMAFDMDAQGNVDVYFVQRFGLVRKYAAATKKVVDLGRLNPPNTVSDGLISIALDPAFKANRWIYLYTTAKDDWRVVRYTLKGEKGGEVGLLDSATEKVILKVPSRRGTVHTGGGMQFDAEGNLWLNTAENGLLWPSANTFDLRGKVLRIRPKPIPDATPAPAAGPGLTYDIPAGNLFPEGMAKTKPEIFVMGARNPYTLTLDRVRKAVTWGDVGPDMGGETEEHNFAAKAGNYGYPYFAGNNIPIQGGGGTPDKPVNPSPGDTALKELPVAVPALNPYKRAIAVTGPVYYYDPGLDSKVKFPPHFNGVWFVSDFGGGYFDAVVLDEAGGKILRKERVLKNIMLNRPLDIQAGPDGAFYVVNYAGSRSTTKETGIMKIEYTGTCQPKGPSPILAPGEEERLGIALTDNGIAFRLPGPHVVKILDLEGRLVDLHLGTGEARYGFAAIRKPGIYLLTAATGHGRITRKIVRP
jgi:cytochrome c